ncbi:hypothetical protein V1264_014973 [Littorina saxatilis]|uniref:G-protein coupled receptors family 1 profile domain-containing protein n=2 Tax=Littorina saxatilis TaxID=31220 RepID=A0AAN9BIK2_9CAEN
MNCTHDPTSHLRNLDPGFMTYYLGAFALLTAVNVGGNSLVLLTIRRHRSMWTPINGFICSLALSDLLLAVIYPTYNVAGIDVESVTSVLGQITVCRILQTESIALELCSSYALVAITVTRYLSIARPLRYHNDVTPRRCIVIVVTLWVASHTACIILYWYKEPEKTYCNICRYEILFSMTQLGVLTSVQSGVPLCLMIVVYVRLAQIARQLKKRVAICDVTMNFETGTIHCRQPTSHRRHRSFVMITLLLGCYVIAWTPIIVYFFLVILGNYDRNQMEYFSATSRIVLYMNSAVNVFIYAGRMGDFRKHVRRDLRNLLPNCCASRKTSQRDDIMIASTVVGMTTRQNSSWGVRNQ